MSTPLSDIFSTPLNKLTNVQLMALCDWQQNRIIELEELVQKLGYVKRVTETHMKVMVN